MPSVLTICTGNICRSPMAQVVLASHLAEAGLASRVQVASRGISDEEHGNPIDRRAATVLRAAGYDVPRHAAARVSASEVAGQDLVLAMTSQHLAYLRRLAPGATTLRMFREFDPACAGLEPSPALDIADPWYGGAGDFELTLQQIEAGTPAIVDYLRRLV